MEELGVVFEELDWKYSPPPPDPASFSLECLSAAEETAEKVVNYIHPTFESEDKRRDVIYHMQRLIKTHVDCEVLPYGSVPLKTYLPDGDIDLTAFQGPNAEESFAHKVLAVLQAEEQNKNSEYQVKDTQFIDAEVKLVKCVVKNFVIDISFNQLGGLSTLCFLEQIDRTVGRNHLFKRSIMLVKTWCYHESRILGAHYGLISTYALETLVLYIFHMFHSSLSGPLAVLYKFLEYYGQFDWENYCISLKGPLCKLSLPNFVVKMPESEWNDRILDEEYLHKCMEMFSVPLSRPEENPKAFQLKCLNIIDPLKENNNLGRSVHKGNFYRIRSAFKYGARKLGQILLQPRDKVADDINDFFASTLARHGCPQRSRIRHLAIELCAGEFLTPSLPCPLEYFSDVDLLLESSSDDNCSVGMEEESLDRYPSREIYLKTDVTTSNSSLTNGTSIYASSSNYNASLDGNHSESSPENGSLGTGNLNQSDSADSVSQKFVLNSWLQKKNQEETNNTYQWCMDSSQAVHTTDPGSASKSNDLENITTLDFRETDLTSNGESESFNHLAELTGDYDSHVRSLLRGQLCRGFTVSAAPVVQTSAYVPSKRQFKKPWDIVRQSIPFGKNHFSQKTSHMVSTTEQATYLASESPLPSIAFCSEWKQRGTGTYFPNTNGFYTGRSSRGWSKNMAPSNRNHFHGNDRNNSLHHTSDKANYYENNTHEVLPNRGKWKSVVRSQSFNSVRVGNQANGHASGTCKIEFGSVGNLAEELKDSKPGVSLETQPITTVTKQEKIGLAPIHLNNEDEFPSLCQSCNMRQRVALYNIVENLD